MQAIWYVFLMVLQIFLADITHPKTNRRGVSPRTNYRYTDKPTPYHPTLLDYCNNNTSIYQTGRLTARTQAKSTDQIKGRFGTGIRWFPHNDPRSTQNVYLYTSSSLVRVTMIAAICCDQSNISLPYRCTALKPRTPSLTR